jgi:hypothetical protein
MNTRGVFGANVGKDVEILHTTKHVRAWSSFLSETSGYHVNTSDFLNWRILNLNIHKLTHYYFFS